MNISIGFRRVLAASTMAVMAFAATAQSFPNKTMSLVVPYPAGGPSDFVARQIQPGASQALGQTVVVENVGGVGGAIGIQKVLSAPQDGHSLVMATPMELILAPLAYSSVKFKPEDLQVVAQVGVTNMVMLTRKDLPYSTVEELIAAGQKPGAKELSYASVGPGTLYHLVGEKFAQLTKVPMLHVPYKGAAPILTDLMGGQIDLVFMPLAGNVRGMIEEGKVKALGITSKVPHPKFPALPALAKKPFLDALEFNLWAGFAVPKGTPAEAASKLHAAIYKAIENPEVRNNLESSGSLVAPKKELSELASLYTAEIARYQGVAKSIKLQPQ